MTSEFRTADASVAGYTPTATEVAELRDWFDRYDELGTTTQLERMADMADFPINLVTDGSTGDAWTGSWSRDEFLAVMSQVMSDGSGEVAFASTRVAFFLTGSLAIVFTDATMTAGGHSHRMRYADILVKKDGVWAFQTMVQGGWADMLTGAATGLPLSTLTSAVASEPQSDNDITGPRCKSHGVPGSPARRRHTRPRPGRAFPRSRSRTAAPRGVSHWRHRMTTLVRFVAAVMPRCQTGPAADRESDREAIDENPR